MFKIKDLMIKVLPADGEEDQREDCGWTDWTCDQTTLCTVFNNTIPCPAGCYTHPETHDYTAEQANIECRAQTGGLAALKQALKDRLEAVEKKEEELKDSELPKTLEEAELLEAKLKEALEEISKLKEDLSN